MSKRDQVQDSEGVRTKRSKHCVCTGLLTRIQVYTLPKEENPVWMDAFQSPPSFIQPKTQAWFY